MCAIEGMGCVLLELSVQEKEWTGLFLELTVQEKFWAGLLLELGVQ
jgi:hypothetical protein